MILTKNEAIRKIKVIKSFLKVLNDNFPTKDVICSTYSSGKIVKREIFPPSTPQHFYFYFSEVNGCFFLGCCNYWVFHDEDYRQLIDDVLKKLALENGFEFSDFYAHPVSWNYRKDVCAKIKTMFITL